MKKHQLKIFKISKNDINGGSIRCYVTHFKNMNYNTIKNTENIQNLLEGKKIKISSINIYKDFLRE